MEEKTTEKKVTTSEAMAEAKDEEVECVSGGADKSEISGTVAYISQYNNY